MSNPLPPVTGPVPIHGSPMENPDRPPVRREIRDLRSNYPKEWTLFLLGLEKFKNVDESHPLSYYQISGIHGLPYTTWPNEKWNQGRIKQADPTRQDPAQWQGFCTHSSILFLPWHRPYLALFETELRRHVQAAAEEFTAEEGGNDYLKAAKTFRLPYWDWALPSGKDNGVFPSGATEDIPQDVVFPKSRKPGGFAMNPLCSYQFGQLGKQDRSINIFPSANRTLRYPIGSRASATEMNEQDLRDSLLDFLKDASIPWVPAINKGKNLTERTLYLLQSYTQFGPVSSNEYFANQGFANYGSLEDLHNALHGICGGNGHMSNPAYAAFDPIFWLHHANIDRLFAIWQALHDKGKSDQYVLTEPARNNDSSTGGTFSTSWKGVQGIDTPLTPFTISENGDMWTSKGVRKTKEFGYLYPETQPWVYPTDNDIYAQINKLYPNASLANTMKVSKSLRQAATQTFTARAETLLAVQKTEIKTAELVAAPAAELNQPQKVLVAAVEEAKAPASRSLEDLVKDDKYLEWLVDIRAAKHSLGGNFQVHVFLGSPDDTNSTLYLADPNHVALFSTFGSSENTGCEACKVGQEIGLQVTGQIPLTIALVERYIAGMLDSITPDDVIPFLQKNLHWRVTDNGGVRGSRADVEGLLVGVVSNEVTISQEDGALPQYAPTVTPWPAATTRENGEGRGRGTGFTG